MKKIYSLLLILGLFSFACTNNDDSDPLDVYREIAYNALSVSEKATVESDWSRAEVSAWVDGNYLVTFTSTSASLADLKVIVDPETGRVVEILPRV